MTAHSIAGSEHQQRHQKTAVKQARIAPASPPSGDDELPMSDEERRMFHAISDPKNAHVFSTEAAFKAFAHLSRA
jgi:hypothetical protein